MKKRTKTILWIVAVVILLIGALTLLIYKCLHYYDPDNFVGLTAEQIIDRYGEFDRCTFWESNGSLRIGVYIVKPTRVGYLGTYYEEYIRIYFDEKGVAYECDYIITGDTGYIVKSER